MSLYIDNKYVRLISSRLRNFKQKKEDLYNFSCPFCGDSKKNKTKARGYVYKKGNDLFYSCHNCNVSTSLSKLIDLVDSSLHKEYVLERYSVGETGRGKTKASSVKFDIPSPKFNTKTKKPNYDYAEWCSNLADDSDAISYLKSRKIPEKHYQNLLYTKHFRDFVDGIFPEHGKEQITNDERIVIPFFDVNGDLIAISGRSISKSTEKLRYVTIKKDNYDDKLIYGLDRINFDKPIKVVEGPIDSLFLDNCLASGDSNLVSVVKQLEIKDATLIFDNEPRNKEIMKQLENAIALGYNVVVWPNSIEEKDINDMVIGGRTKEELEKIIVDNTHSGLKAKVKLTFIKKV